MKENSQPKSPLWELYQQGLRNAKPEASELLDVEAQPDAGSKAMARRYNRIIRWAARQSKSALASDLASLFLSLMLERVRRRSLQSFAQSSESFITVSVQERARLNVENDRLLKSLLKHHEDRRKGAVVKLAKDPKQAAKAQAFKLWADRHAGKHPELRTEDQFASECCRRWPVLTSISGVKKWSTAWRKELRAWRSGGNRLADIGKRRC